MVSIETAMNEFGTGIGLFFQKIGLNIGIFMGFFIFIMVLFAFLAMIFFLVKRVKELT